MRIRRRLPLILAVVLVIAAVVLAVVLRKHAPPEAARLLPGADGFVYVNLGWMRRANLTGELPPVPHDPDYEQFIQATGIQFERDLDEAALAIHYPAGSSDTKSGYSHPRFSEVLAGKFDGERLRAYLRQISSSVDTYQTRDIYNIPLEGRTLRVSILGVDTVAASNLDDSQVIRGIIQRSRKLASPFGGPALLRQYYKEVPLASLGWAIFKIQPSAGFAVSGPVIGWSFLFAKPATVVASVRYLGAVHFKAQAFTGSDEEASQVAARIDTYFNLFRTAESTVPAAGTDADIKAFFDSLKIQAQKNRAVLTGAVPLGLIRKVLVEAPSSVLPQAQAPENNSSAESKNTTKKKKAPNQNR
jgi:hypothetical protein